MTPDGPTAGLSSTPFLAGRQSTAGASADPARQHGAQRAEETIAYFRALEEAFACAGGRARATEHTLRPPGSPSIRLRLKGTGIREIILPAVAPILSPDLGGPAEIEVRVWDGSAGTVPPPPWRLRDVITRGDVLATRGTHLRVQVDTGHHTVTLWDAHRRLGLMWTPLAARLPYWARAAPLRSILHWALAGAGRHLLHAAGIGDEQVGALLVGPSGSGKSTTALACLLAEVGYVADDYLLAETAPSPRAHALYGTAKVGERSVHLLPELAPYLPHDDGQPKAVLDVAGRLPHLMRRSMAITAIVMPRVSAGEVTLRRVPAVEALRALAPSTILQSDGESTSGMALMAELVRRVPAYELRLGSDIGAVGPAIQRLLESQR